MKVDAPAARFSRLVVAAALGLALAGCVSAPARPARAELPEAAEPRHAPASYRMLPPGTTMAVVSSTADLIAQLKEAFPALALDTASLVLVDEQLITAGGAFYRRVAFSYGDETTWSMHGSCSQNVVLWFKPSGERVGTYVDAMHCPI